MKSPAQRIRKLQERLWCRAPSLRPREARPIPEDGRLVLGRDNASLPFGFDTRLLSAHIDMVGGIGGGKSTAMRHLAWLNMETPPHLNRATIIIDPHGLHEDSLLRATLRRAVDTKLYQRKKVYVIDANSDWCTGLRLLDGSAQPSVLADHLIEGFERLHGDETLLEKPTLRRALHGLMAVLAELGWSIAEADLLLDPVDPHGLRAWALKQINDRYAKKALLRLQHLANDPRLIKDFAIETIGTENRLAPLLSSPAMRAIVGSQTLDMRDVLDEGAVLLVNTAGHDAASETAGDLLGKLVMRAVLFAAKRRRTNSLALVFADECARYVSQDWERALAELRKYRVGIVSAHQTFAMLGKPGDPVRDAIEKIPATKIAFRMNSMEEASALAPDLVKLNLEMPVEALKAQAVVGYQVRRMANGTLGGNATQTRSNAITTTTGTGTTRTDGETAGTSKSRTVSDQQSVGRSASHSRGTTRSHVETDTDSESEGTSWTTGRSSSRGGGRSETSGWSHGSNFSQNFDVPVNSWRSAEGVYSQAAAFGVANARQVTSGYDQGESHSAGHSEDWSSAKSESQSYSRQRSRSSSVADGIAESNSRSEGTTWGSSRGVSNASGSHVDRSRSTARSRQDSTGKTSGESNARGATWARGWSEAMVPILRERPTAVHSLQNVTHMAAEMLCSLPTGVAVVRTINNGSIEGALVRVPERPCLPVSDSQYASDLRKVMMHHGSRMLMCEAQRQIEARERALIAAAAQAPPADEPATFRVTGPQGQRRARGKPDLRQANPVKGGRPAVAPGDQETLDWKSRR